MSHDDKYGEPKAAQAERVVLTSDHEGARVDFIIAPDWTPAIRINVGGNVVVKTARAWHEAVWAAVAARSAALPQPIADMIANQQEPTEDMRRAASLVASRSSERPHYKNPLKVLTSEWRTDRNENEVTCHSRMVDGVLCRWWGDDMPPGVEKINAAASATRDSIPLTCEVKGGVLDMSIGEKVLAFATANCPALWDAEKDRQTYAVTDPATFAKEVANTLNKEAEDGSTMLSRMLDRAVLEAIEQGAEGIEEIEGGNHG